MSEQALSSVSSLPVAAFLVPLALGIVILLGRRLSRWVWQGLAVLATGVTLCIGIIMAGQVISGMVLTSWGNELRVDGLSAFMVVVVSGIAFLTSVYSIRYILQPAHLERLGAGRSDQRLWMFHWLLLWFLAAMVWGCVTNNVIMLYVAVEATTLTSGLLVAFYWDRKALEAGYKYLILLTIGLTFALFGCVLVYASAAATGELSGRSALLLSEVGRVAQQMPRGTAVLAVAFLVIGFGAKAGIAPFHPWLPDAHAEAPTPISVLLSGVMIKMAAYALARTTSMFFPAWPAFSIFLVALGVFTMLLGVIMAFNQDDLKRLLAYSSVSQIGYVVAGIGLGTYLGCFGGLYHLLNHAIFKSLLFMCVGAIIYVTGMRKMSELGGLAEKMPITGVCFFLGALAIAGFPPLNGFVSKFTIYLALAESGLWWALVLALITGILTVVVLVRASYRVFWGAPQGAGGDAASSLVVREVPASMWIPMVVLAGACLFFGIFYQVPYPLLDKAATALATVGR